MDVSRRVRAHRGRHASTSVAGSTITGLVTGLVTGLALGLVAPSAAVPSEPTIPAATPAPLPSPTAVSSAVPSAVPVLTPSRVSVRLSRSAAPIGQRVLVRGTVSGGARTVSLQTRDSQGRWRSLERRTSRRDGSFVFNAPLWNRTHPLRVRASATRTADQGTSRVVTLRRFVPYSTGGRSTSWVPLGQLGVTRWNPCVTHSVQISTRHAPSWFGSEVRAALKDLHLYTGLNFKWSGATSQRSPDRLGRWRHADVVLLWTDEQTDQRLSGAVVAIGGAWFKFGSRADGFVHLDRDTSLSRAQWRLVIRHELAHVMGLGHSRDDKQRMHHNSSLGLVPASIGNRWGRGDIAGLKQVGAAQGCTD